MVANVGRLWLVGCERCWQSVDYLDVFHLRKSLCYGHFFQCMLHFNKKVFLSGIKSL